MREISGARHIDACTTGVCGRAFNCSRCGRRYGRCANDYTIHFEPAEGEAVCVPCGLFLSGEALGGSRRPGET